MADRRRQYCPCKACSSRTPPLAQLRRTIYNHVKKDEAAEEKRKFMKNREKEKRKAEEKKNEQKKASAKAQLANLSTPSAQGALFSIQPPSSLDRHLRLEESDSGPDVSEYRARMRHRRETEDEQIRRVERRAAYNHILKVCQDAIDQLDAASLGSESDKVGMRLLSPEPNFGVKRRREDAVGRDEQVRLPLHRERRSSPAGEDLRRSPYIYQSLQILSCGEGIDSAGSSLAERSRARRHERDERRRREQAENAAREAGPSASHIESGEPGDESGQDEGVLITDMLCTKCGEASLSEEELKELKELGW